MSDRVSPVGGPKSGPITNAPDEITVQKDGTKLSDIAKSLGIEEADLRAANPQINPKKPLQKGQQVHYPKDMLVQDGEKTLEDVAKRTGMSQEYLEKANPHLKGKQLRRGQAISFGKDFKNPKATGEPERGVKSKPRITSEGGAGKVGKGDGAAVYKPPTVKIGGREIPLPDVIIADGPRPGVGGTNGTYDGTGEANINRRKQETDNISNTRGKDDRDLDKDAKKKLDDDQKRRGYEKTDEQIRKGTQNKPKMNVEEEYQERLRREAIDFVRKGGR